MDAVILRQSVQLQTKVSTRPGPWVGWWVLEPISERRRWIYFKGKAEKEKEIRQAILV